MSYRSSSDAAASSVLARAIGKASPQPSIKSRMIERARAAEKAAGARSVTKKQPEAQRAARDRITGQREGAEAWPLPGLAPMTRVRTSFGDVHAAALRKGDKVLTRSGAFMPIVWLNRILLEEHLLALKPDCNPVVLAAGALGPGIPATEIMVSPRQIIRADDQSRLSSAREAATLISRPGIRRLRETSLSYTMFHVGEPAEIYCEGLFLSFPLEA